MPSADKEKSQKNRVDDPCFIRFDQSVDAHALPERFTFPFYYDPHPLCLLAAEKLQKHLETQSDWEHNFGLDPSKSGMIIGKMFGVLIVQNEDQEIGYLAAFSGKLADENHHAGFVPPVFDMLTEGSFFNVGSEELNELNARIEVLERNPDLLEQKAFLAKEKALRAQELERCKQRNKMAKAARKLRREQERETLSPEEFKTLDTALSEESKRLSIQLKHLTRDWKARLAKAQAALDVYTNQIVTLQKERKAKSGALQKRLFDQYQFLNQKREPKSLLDIFVDTPPPAGAGECAAPKLLQYAFQHRMKPIAMAEFWWGQSPKSEIRKHGHFYPTCRGKCEPILSHMLAGIEMDENPMLTNPAIGKEIQVIYEDDQLAVVHKPAEFLSVPGKVIEDSVAFRMKIRYPEATGPLVVHRLDMSTSGLMLIAKSQEVHKFLQRQFIKRTVKKRYVALLDGILAQDEGTIDLPLRVDLDNRPCQLVCYEHGKSARTQWKVVERKNKTTRIHFFPITGRTHQLRVHAAHTLGLDMPIIGDDLYGKKGERLHLHAEFIEFLHPQSRERMAIELPTEF